MQDALDLELEKSLALMRNTMEDSHNFLTNVGVLYRLGASTACEFFIALFRRKRVQGVSSVAEEIRLFGRLSHKNVEPAIRECSISDAPRER
jgi:hypothetical protein